MPGPTVRRCDSPDCQEVAARALKVSADKGRLQFAAVLCAADADLLVADPATVIASDKPYQGVLYKKG